MGSTGSGGRGGLYPGMSGSRAGTPRPSTPVAIASPAFVTLGLVAFGFGATYSGHERGDHVAHAYEPHGPHHPIERRRVDLGWVFVRRELGEAFGR